MTDTILTESNSSTDQPTDWTSEDLQIVEVNGEPVSHCLNCTSISSPDNSDCPNCGASLHHDAEVA